MEFESAGSAGTIAWAAQHFAGLGAGIGPALEHHLAVDEDVLDAHGCGTRLGERGLVLHALRVEDNKIGGKPLGNPSAIGRK